MKSSYLPINYSIKNIVGCILADNRAAKRYTSSAKKKRYGNVIKNIQSRCALKSVLSISHIKKYPVDGVHYFARIGVLPPELVIVDKRIQDMCALPFWTIYRSGRGPSYRHFGPCPGYDRLPGCPPNAPPTEKTQTMLDSSDALVVLQTKLLDERWNDQWKFAVLHRLASDLAEALGPSAITGVYGSGPCSACTQQHCRYNSPCRHPERQTISLEARGICVERMCDDLSLVTGNKAWKISWLKHFGFAQQSPKTWKYVVAVSIKLT